jgi:vancomycin resistance protein YoaR
MRLPGSFEVRRVAAMIAVVAAAGVAITGLLLPPAPPKPEASSPPRLRVAGTVLEPSGDLASNALDLVRRYAWGEIQVRLPDGSTRALRRNTLGAEIDRVRLAGLVAESQRAGSALQRAHEEARKSADEPIDVPLPVSLDADTAIRKLLDIKAELDAPATDAFVDLDQKKLRPEKVGHRLDVYGTLARIDIALRKGDDTVDAAVEEIAPKLVAASLGDVKFDSVLGYFETRYTPGEKYKDRTYNLRLAASKLDGAIVMPGATFDFNATVGPRDEAHGYRVAPVIAQGELVDGLGGGTCQISGTLHGAAFFAGLDIVERYPHSRPSFYIKLGLDATVVYPTINFRLKNPFDFPIVLHETVAGGVVRAEVLGPSRKHTVTYFRRIDAIVPFEEATRETPKLPAGKRVIAQRGIPGFKTTSSRVVRDGAYAVREKWSDAYPPTTQIVHVGTGPEDLASDAADDAHPEYLVDEYLVVTQGPDIRTPGEKGPEPGGGTIEGREPGRTGGAGWTESQWLTRLREAGAGEPVTLASLGALPPLKSEPDDKDSKAEKAANGTKASAEEKGASRKTARSGEDEKGKSKKKKKKKEKDAPRP